MVTRNEMQHHNTNNTGSPQQFCLRWNNYQSNLTNVFDQLLQSESFVDVTLACDGHSLKAHKMVLSACSPYFQSLFNDNPCHHPIVIMRDIKWPELKSAVEFMYKGEINVSQEQIGPLLKVAETLKIRGLADVNDLGQGEVVARPTSKPMPLIDTANSPPSDWSSSGNGGPLISGRELKCEQPPPQPPPPPSSSSSVQQQSNAASEMSSIISGAKKRRRSPERRSSSPISPPNNIIGGGGGGAGDLMMGEISGNSVVEMSPSAPSAHTPSSSSAMACEQSSMALPSLGLPPPINQTVGMGSHQADDMEIKPGIAEMIREEERAKLLESSHAWLASSASTSSLAADSYQYQLQSMWQKCWNTNQSLVHNLRFRERGPLKSWRPETMAEAIFSVLKEGLSLSQAARKYDIPYPTFVLYANRVHNMLGPSADGGSEFSADLRPKGRGRPQRILLGVWPDEHIRGVIRAVVFRDSHQIKEEAAHIPAYARLHEGISIQSYPNNSCSNGSDPNNVSPGAAAAAAVAAVAQGLRQQMCSMVAAAHNQNSAHDTNPTSVANLVNSLALAGHCGNVPLPSNGGAPPMSMSHLASMRSMSSPAGSIQDLRISPAESAGMESPISSPLGLTVSSSMEPSINMNIGKFLGNNMDVGIGVSGMTYKPSRSFTSPRPENLFQEDIDDLVKPIHHGSSSASARSNKDSMSAMVKMEPMTECRGD